MLDKFFRNKKEDVEGKVSEIIKALGVLLEFTNDDRKILEGGVKLDFPKDDNGESQRLFNEALDLLSSGVLSTKDTEDLQNIVTAIDENYNTVI